MDSNYLSAFSKSSIKLIETLETFTYVISNILCNQSALGVDIENSTNTYDGFISLLQISYLDEQKGVQNYVFDVVKIFHGQSPQIKADIC